MKKAVSIIFVLSFAISGYVKGQGSYTSVQYLMGFGVGDLGSYIAQPSFRGAVLDHHRSITDNISAGIELGWNVFYERKDYDTYSNDQVSVSGIQYRYSNNLPILATFEYNLNPENPLKPYANVGIGTMYTERDTEMGIWLLSEKAWHFAFKPELGLLYEVNENAALKIAAKYYYGSAAGDLGAQSYFALAIGLTLF